MTETTKAFADDNSGRILLCFYDSAEDYHLEYFHDLRTSNFSMDKPEDRQYFINSWEVGIEQFKTMLDALHTLAGELLPIPDAFNFEDEK